MRQITVPATAKGGLLEQVTYEGLTTSEEATNARFSIWRRHGRARNSTRQRPRPRRLFAGAAIWLASGTIC